MIIPEEEQEFHSIFRSNKKHIYWKLTEDGLVYCSNNCLLKSNNIKNTFEFVPQIDFHATLNIINKEKNQFYNRSTLRQYFNSIPSPIQPHTQVIVSELNVDLDEVDPLNCLPYSNHTNYDFLKSFSKREKLIGIPEPDLITMFERNSKIDLETLRQRLIEMKKEVEIKNSFLQFKISINKS